MKIKINKDLLPMKGHYFLFNAATAPIQPFLPVYAKQLGFSSVVVGTVYSILPVTGMLAKPIFGAIADNYKKHKFLFLLFQVITAIAFFTIQFIPSVPIETESKVKIVCKEETNFHTCTNDFKKSYIADKLVDTEGLVECGLRCNLNSEFQDEVCNSWKLNSPICSYSSPQAQIRNAIAEHSHSLTKKSEPDSLGKDLYSEKYSSLTTNDSRIRFIAYVPLNHTLQVKNCTYFRVGFVQLPNGTKHRPICNKEVDAECDIFCNDRGLTKFFTNKVKSKESVDVTSLYQFWLLLLFMIISWVGMAVVVSIADAMCFELLGERASEYGNQRLWGSVGWGLLAIITGLVVDEFSKEEEDNHKNYTPAFYLMLIFFICDFICSHSLKYDQSKISSNLFKDVGRLLRSVPTLIFMVWCVFIGMCQGIQWNFLFWYLEVLGDAQGEPYMKTLEGLVSGVQCFLGELPSFFFSGWILRKIGHIHSMTLVLFVVGVRFILYSVLSDPWWCLPIELLQGTFGLFYPTMTSYASIVAAPGTEATVQGLVGALFEGVGVSIGSLLGGVFFDSYGGAVCFRIFGISAFVMFVLHGVLQYFLNRGNMGTRLQGKDFNSIARYATPNEAVSMLEDS